MTWFDVVVLAVAGWAAWSGWALGASGVVWPAVGSVAGLVGASVLLPSLALRTSPAQVALRFWVLNVGFVLFVILGFAVGRWIAGRSSRLLRPSVVSRLMGALLAVAIVAVVLWEFAPLSRRQSLLQAVSAGSKTAELMAALGEPPIDIERLIAQDVFPTVLTEVLAPSAPLDPPPSVFPPIDTASLRNAEASSVQIAHTSCDGYSLGSGFSIGDGHVVTNAHVVEGSGGQVDVLSGAGDGTGTVVTIDHARDLAVLSVPSISLPGIPLAASAAERGDLVITLGHPKGTADLHLGSASVQSRMFAPIRVVGREPAAPLIYVLSTDDIEPGSSGGAVIDTSGSAVAVVFAAPPDGADYAFAIAIDELRPLLDGPTSAPVDVGPCPVLGS